MRMGQIADTVLVFDGDLTYGFLNGRVRVAARNPDAVEAYLQKKAEEEKEEFPFDKPKKKKDKGEEKGESKKHEESESDEEEEEEHEGDSDADSDDDDKPAFLKGAKVTTPNGLEGQILGKVSGLWGDEVTVRLENGRIAHLHVSDDMAVTPPAEEKVTPIERLASLLEADYSTDKDSLLSRKAELDSIRSGIHALIAKGVSHEDEANLDQIRLAADFETSEINDTLGYLDSEEAEAYEPPAPFEMNAVEQESMGWDGGVVDSAYDTMTADTAKEDFAKLMDEGPEVFTAELDDSALVDAGAVRSLASSFIREKTAGTNPNVQERFEKVWLARIEKCRQSEVVNRKQTVRKEAASKEDKFRDLPDEMLFG